MIYDNARELLHLHVCLAVCFRLMCGPQRHEGTTVEGIVWRIVCHAPSRRVVIGCQQAHVTSVRSGTVECGIMDADFSIITLVRSKSIAES